MKNLRLISLLLAICTVLMLLPVGNAAAAGLGPGDRGNQVKYLQQNLIGLGFLTGTADGRYGNGTKAAVKAFQAEYGLSTDGKAGERTQTAVRNAMVRVQIELQLEGCAPGSADGHFGSKTKAALKRYQELMGLKVTGIADQATRSEMDDNTPGLQVTRKLGKGSNRTQVKYLQRALIGLGFLTGSDDGSYGPMTQAAVRNYQKAYGLGVDGSAGPDTLTSIKNTVVTIQSDLNRKGYSSGTINGVYGNGTKAAVKSYQKAVKLSATGVAGSETIQKLWKVSFYSTAAASSSDSVKVSITSQYQDGDYRKIYYGWNSSYTTTVHTSGCAGVSMAMALNALLDTGKHNGQNVMQWFADNEAYYGSGTHQRGLINYPRELGLRSTYCDKSTDLVGHLKKGRLAIALVSDKSGDAFFCAPESRGHFILLSGYREKDGVPQVFVNNSLSYKASRWFNLSDIMANVKNDRDGYFNSFVVVYE